MPHPYTNSDAVKATFLEDLKQLRKRYPMVYFETWTPDDFQTALQGSTEDAEGDADWTDGFHIETADTLQLRFDASLGTNWDRIRDAQES